MTVTEKEKKEKKRRKNQIEKEKIKIKKSKTDGVSHTLHPCHALNLSSPSVKGTQLAPKGHLTYSATQWNICSVCCCVSIVAVVAVFIVVVVVVFVVVVCYLIAFSCGSGSSP